MQFLVSGNNQFSRINVGCPTAAEALKKAKDLVDEVIWTREYARHEVKSCCPMSSINLMDSEMPKVHGGQELGGGNEHKAPENGI